MSIKVADRVFSASAPVWVVAKQGVIDLVMCGSFGVNQATAGVAQW
ncbi:MAG: hypothetical protein ABL985_09325 [Casimicrobium sp.]